jgi:hypothetical protein
MKLPEVLPRITSILEAAGIPYMLTGSFASMVYGAPRSTQDIDLVIAATAGQLRAFVAALPRGEYYAELDAALEALGHESLFNVIDLKTGWKIDLIICKSRPFSQEEFKRRQPIDIEGFSLFVACAEDVILAKLEWAKLGQSQRQIDDVIRIMQTQGSALNQAYLHKWVAELLLEEQWRDARRGANPSDVNTSPE